jgi:hypothetical protein
LVDTVVFVVAWKSLIGRVHVCRVVVGLVVRIVASIRDRRGGGKGTRDLLDGSLADGAPRYSAHQVTVLESNLNWSSKLISLVDSRQPEGVGVGKVVASTSAVALDEWSSPVGLKAGAWGSQVLSAALTASTGVHDEGVADPEWDVIPTSWALGHIDGLAVEGHDIRLGFADNTPGDVLLDISAVDVGHSAGHSSTGRQPVRVVVSRS